MNCKNCELEDEYCASGDCPTSQSPRNDLATKPQAVDLTEQWRKGKLMTGVTYYVEDVCGNINALEYIDKGIKGEFSFDDSVISKILAPVPSYDEWKRHKSNFIKRVFGIPKNRIKRY